MFDLFKKSARMADLEAENLAADATIKRLADERNAALNRLAARNIELIRVRSERVTCGKLAEELLAERDALQSRLDEIAAMETPSCAHIGKKMAAVARGDALAEVA